MRAEIISVGTELLLGDIVNTNAQFLARELAGLGCTVYYQTVVGDNAVRLRTLIAEAKDRSDILIFTGGLGPTSDDLTKETVAEAFGDVLVPDAEELVKIEHFFKKRGLAMTENNKKQAMVPRFGRKIINDNGTAPGAFFRQGNKYAILLPGPPREMKPMFTQEVMPLLEAMQDSAIRSVTMCVFGMGESALEEKAGHLLQGENPTAALYAKTGEVHIRITAKAPTAEAADILCSEMAGKFAALLGNLIYSYKAENLETVAVGALLAKGYTIATAESCTGGLLGQRITSVPGASGAYGFGAITYSNEVKRQLLGVKNATLRKFGAVSSQVAAEMAFGAADKANTDFGLGITGIAGPNGGTEKKPVGLVYIAVCSGAAVYVKKLQLGSRGRAYVRELACHNALDMLRRIASGLPMPGTKRFKKQHFADFEREGKPKKRTAGLARAVLAILLVAAILFLSLWASSRFAGGQTPALPAATLSAPGDRGLLYGSAEYAAAAMALVQQTKAENPNIAGFVAMPGPGVQSLVASPKNTSQAQIETVAAPKSAEDLPFFAQDAPQKGPGTNALLFGQNAFDALWEYEKGTMGESLSTFTYFTAGEAAVYKIISVYVADSAQPTKDQFVPSVPKIAGHKQFLEFLLGLKIRSLYDLQVEADETDSFVTLAAPHPKEKGRSIYFCGRALRPNETPQTPLACTAASPLMPSAWYAQQGQKKPDEDQLYAFWLRWYLSRNATNPALQLAAGMPLKDTAPLEESPAAQPFAASANLAIAPGQNRVLYTGQSISPLVPIAGASSAQSGALGQGSAQNSKPAQSSTSTESAASQGTGASLRPRVLPLPLPKKANPAYLTVTMNGQLVTDSTLNILAQICQRDAGALEPPAIKALAICAHSWILNQQGAGNAAPAVVGSLPSQKVLGAVLEVKDIILSPDGTNPAFTPWFSMAAKGTNTAQNVFGAPRSYLDGQAAPGDAGQNNYTQIITVPKDKLASLAKQKLDADLATLGPPETWLGKIQHSPSGYVQSLEVFGKTFAGTEFWDKFLVDEEGKAILPSPAFEAEFDGENFSFICYGSGHGCGLSLAGANTFARQSVSHESILEKYFPTCSLVAW